MSKKRLFLIDAFAMIYRAYFAQSRNPLINKKGQETTAIYGFLSSLEEILRVEQPDYVAVVFDPPGGTFRHKEFDDYKAHRPETPDAIRFAVPYIKQLLNAYNIVQIEVPNYEADDVIGALSWRAADEGYAVYMVTPDKDYAQLIREGVAMYRPNHRGGGYQVWHEAEACKYFDLNNCSQVIDYLALVGDSSDNIPGCPGIGKVTASKLLKQYGSLDDLYTNIDGLSETIRRKLSEGKEQTLQSQYLARIEMNVIVEESLASFQRRQPKEEELIKLYEELEFASALNRMDKYGVAKPSSQVEVLEEDLEYINYLAPAEEPQEEETPQEVANPSDESAYYGGLFAMEDDSKATDDPASQEDLHSKEDFLQALKQIKKTKQLALKTLNSDPHPLKGELLALGLATDSGKSYVLFMPQDKGAIKSYLEPLQELLLDDKILKIGHSIKDDMQVLLNYGLDIPTNYEDTMLIHYLTNADFKHKLSQMADVYLNLEVVNFDDFQKKKRDNPSLLTQDEISSYLHSHTSAMILILPKLLKELDEKEQTALYRELELPLLKVLQRMERVGVRLDVDILAEQQELLYAQLKGLEDYVQEVAGEPININSPKQIGELLFEKLALDPKAKPSKSGNFSTSEDKLEKIKSRHPVVEKILEYRGLKKLLSTYVEALPHLLDREGKLHTIFNQAVASTGRLSSSNPNIQNIPIRTENGKEIRRAFVADKGDYTFVSADYSQIELRLMAHFSGDENLINAFLSGEDVHRATAAKIHHISLEEVSDDMRRAAKMANFGIIYGISTFGLAERLGVPRGEAKKLIEGYFATYPKVKEYMENVLVEAKEQGYVSTLLGRRRYLADINNANSVVRAYAERNAINAPLQGTAADIIKLAMVKLDAELRKRKLKTTLVLQVHDELNLNVPNEELEEVKVLLKETMESAFELVVPLLVEVGSGTNWLEAH